jgi:L-lactate dehydrogenase complex protein LldG
MSREGILGRISKGLGAQNAGARKAVAAQRLATPPSHTVPLAGRLPSDECKARFIAALASQGVAVIEVADVQLIPPAVADYLKEEGLPLRLRMTTDESLAHLPWEASASKVALSVGAAAPGDRVAMSHALAGVAETGTLMLVSNAKNPVSLAFLPEVHIVALHESAIVGSFEAAFAVIKPSDGGPRLPRACNLISAPSRTGDIGGRIVVGAHGPRRLVAVIYG